MLDYAQSFEEFSSGLKPIDLALYAGIGIILWVLFKDKLSPVQKLLSDLVTQAKGFIGKTNTTETPKPTLVAPESNDIFFELVASWKQTRDLAVKSGCDEAVKVADQMFPYLSPTICGEEKV
jgi:hypothetical protein